MKTQELGDKVLVTTQSGAYQLSKETWAQLEPLLEGQDIDALLSVVASVKASDVKEYDAEKAARARERAAKEKALEAFEGKLASHKWSKAIIDLAEEIAILRQEVSELESVPMAIDFASLEEVSGYAMPGQYSFRSVVRNDRRYTIVEVAPDDVPVISKRNELETALASFRVKCADATAKLVPAILGPSLKVNSFDVDTEGNVVFDYHVKIRRSGSGGGRKRKGYYLYKEQQYPTLTALGEAIDTNGTKYPHKVGAAAVDRGDAIFVPADAESES